MRCWRRLLSSPPRGAASSFLARARGSRVAEHPSELSFAKGETLTVLGEAPKGWVRAARGDNQNQQIGLVPATFLEKVETRALVRRFAGSDAAADPCAPDLVASVTHATARLSSPHARSTRSLRRPSSAAAAAPSPPRVPSL